MSLTKCTECRKEISDKAISCPNCGYPITCKSNLNSNEDEESENKNDTLQGILSIIFGILGLLFALIAGGTVSLISLIFFITSAILGVKSSKKFSIIGVLISGFGIASFLVDCLLPVLL